MFIVGIDVAKRSHEVCMITSDRPAPILYPQQLHRVQSHAGENQKTHEHQKPDRICDGVHRALLAGALYAAAQGRLPRHSAQPDPNQRHAGYVHPQDQNRCKRFLHHRRADPLRALCRKQCCAGSSAGAEGAVPEPLLSGRHGR